MLLPPPLRFWSFHTVCGLRRTLGTPLIQDVEAVGKPQNFEFSRQKALCFQGSNFQKETFSTASLGGSP